MEDVINQLLVNYNNYLIIKAERTSISTHLTQYILRAMCLSTNY